MNEKLRGHILEEFPEEDFLSHHGIFGMKWGVRRYQNGDGSLTSEGRERYLKDPSATRGGTPLKDKISNYKTKKAAEKTKKQRQANIKKAQETRKKNAEAKKKAEAETEARKKKSNAELTKKDISKMSNEEIKERIDRADLEKRLSSIMPTDVNRGERIKKEIMDSIEKGAVEGVQLGIKNIVTTGLTALGNKAFSEDNDKKDKNQNNNQKQNNQQSNAQKNNAQQQKTNTSQQQTKKTESAPSKEQKREATNTLLKTISDTVGVDTNDLFKNDFQVEDYDWKRKKPQWLNAD